MIGAGLRSWSREELEAEVARLTAIVKEARTDARRVTVAHEGELATSRAETAQANRDARQAQSDARDAARDHHREMLGATADLANSMDLVAALQASQAALASSEARQRAVFESAIDFAMVVTDREGIVTEWNPGAERVMGWTADEMRGQNADRFFTPEDRAIGRIDYEMQLALRDGRASDERWHLRRGETRFWASGEMMPLRDGDGAHIGFVKILRDRTSEHLTGKALDDAQRRLRRAQEAGGIGLFTVDLADNRLRPTLEFCRLFGLSAVESYPATTIEALIIPEDMYLVSNAASRARGEIVQDAEYRIRRADTGELRWINRKGEIEYEDGRPVRFSGAARDVTEQRSARDRLAASEARYRALFDTMDEGFCIIEFIDGPHGASSDYNHVEANPGYERQTGIAGIVGQTIRGLAPAEADGWVELYGEVLRTGRTIRFERYFAAAGRDIEVSAVRIEPASLRQVSILFRDISGRKEAEAALRASEAVARENIERVQLALAAGAIIGTWHWDIPGDRFTVDEGFAQAFGLDASLGRSGIPLAQIVATVHPEDRAGLASAIDEAVGRGGAYSHQYRVRRTDGNYYWIEANGRVDHGPDGAPKGFPGVLIDVQERRAIAAERDRATEALRALNDTLEQRVMERTEELMRAEEALRQSQKMEAVGQLTGGLAHDFNNLLAGISGSLEMMNTRITQGRFKDVEKYMVAAQGASKRAAALTHRLLAFSRRQTLEPKTTDVNVLANGMLDLIRRTVGPSIEVTLAGAPQLWSVLVDSSQLENALLNLCINARDAMPEGGRVTIETANRDIDSRQAEMRDMPPGEYLVLSVSDNGSGMPPEVVARVFEPFFTTKPTGQGTGLGLSMIYGFAKQSGGQVRVHSVVAEGTSISIYLPRHLGQVDAGEDRAQAVFRPTAEAGETVLVVDDEPTVRMLVMDVLSDLGYVSIEAGDGIGGLKVLESNARVDLLVTDVGLPGGMNGRQMADAARVHRPDLKVLFISGFAEAALFNNGHLDPGMAVLTKPFAVDVLAARVREMIAH